MTNTPDHLDNFANDYKPELWGMAVAPLAASQGIPYEFVTEAIREESNGNPCAIGAPDGYGPDGNPRELGPYQFYNPDDLNLLKISGTQMRAFCGTEKVAYHKKDGTVIMGPSQRVSRPLTSDEITMIAKGIVDKIAQSRGAAAHAATLVGLKWPMGPNQVEPGSTDYGIDFWRLVKLEHGLPGLVSNGLAHVTNFLSRPPASWFEFRHLIQSGQVKCDPETERYRGSDGFAWIFNNAEKATSTMPGKALS